MTRLSEATLAGLPARIRRPAYDRSRLATGIVHLGIGAFHRAHQAVYTDDVLAAGDLRWGIAGASLRSPATRDALAPQDGLYAQELRADQGAEIRVIGSIRELLVAPGDPAALLRRIASPSVAIVSLTVTEKGYCHDPATGELDEDHPDIRHDLAHPEAPRSAIGFLAAGIERRRRAGLPPLTLMSCDNLPANGRSLHRILGRYAALVSPDLGRHVAGEIACPDTMIDRIVPATTDADRARIAAALGVEDAWPVVAEPFIQWVIEDRFAGPRPEWEGAGATLTGDVAPFEAMKLRLLNGSHSALAYLGCLAGRETIADAMADPDLAGFVEGLMGDAAATLSLPPGTDVDGYRRSLLERFRNRALRHRTAQIAMDGSQKLPQRLLGTMRDRLAAGLAIDRHALAVVAWMRYVTGPDPVNDPLAATFSAIAKGGGDPVEALLGIGSIFGADLPADGRFRAALSAAWNAIGRLGPIGAARDWGPGEG